MQLFSPMCIHSVYILIFAMQIGINQVGSTLPSVKIRRTHSMRVQRTRPSSSSSSASSTASHMAESESKPLASTSTFHEINIEPIIEERSRQVRFGSTTSLIDPMAVTQGEHLDPMRDGAFARIKSAMIRYGAAVGIGTAIGAGGFAVRQIFQNNNHAQENFTDSSSNLSNQTYDETLINSIGEN